MFRALFERLCDLAVEAEAKRVKEEDAAPPKYSAGDTVWIEPCAPFGARTPAVVVSSTKDSFLGHCYKLEGSEGAWPQYRLTPRRAREGAF